MTSDQARRQLWLMGVFWCALQGLRDLHSPGVLGLLAEFAGSLIGGTALWGWWLVLTVCGMDRWRGVALWTLTMLAVCWLAMGAVLSIDVASDEFWRGLGQAWNAAASGRSAYSVPWIGPLIVMGSFAVLVLAAPGVVPMADKVGRVLEAEARGRSRLGPVVFWTAWAAGVNALPLVVSAARDAAMRSGVAPSVGLLLPAVALVWLPLGLAFAVRVLPEAVGVFDRCVRRPRRPARLEPPASGANAAAGGPAPETAATARSDGAVAGEDPGGEADGRMPVARRIAELYRSMELQPRLAARRPVKARFLAELLAVGSDGVGALRSACLTEAETAALMALRARTLAALGEADGAEPRTAAIDGWRARLADDAALAVFMGEAGVLEGAPDARDAPDRGGDGRAGAEADPAIGSASGDGSKAGSGGDQESAVDAAAEARLRRGMVVFPALARAVDGWTRDLDGLAGVEEAARAADRALAVLEGREAGRGDEVILEELLGFLHEIGRLPDGHDSRLVWSGNAAAALEREFGLMKELRRESSTVADILRLASAPMENAGEGRRSPWRNRSALELMARLGGHLGDTARTFVAGIGSETGDEVPVQPSGAAGVSDRRPPASLDAEDARRLTERLAAQGQWDSSYRDLERRRRTVEKTRALAMEAVRHDDGLRYRQGMLIELDGKLVPVHAIVEAVEPDGKPIRSLLVTGIDVTQDLPEDGEPAVRFDEADLNPVIGAIRDGVFIPVREIDGFATAVSMKATGARIGGGSGWLGVMLLYGVRARDAVNAETDWIRKVVQRFNGDVAVLSEEGATPEMLRELVAMSVIDGDMARRRCLGEPEPADGEAW